MDNNYIYNFYYKKYKKKQNGGSLTLSTNPYLPPFRTLPPPNTVDTFDGNPIDTLLAQRGTNVQNTGIDSFKTNYPYSHTGPIDPNEYSSSYTEPPNTEYSSKYSELIKTIYSYVDYAEPLNYGNSHNIFPVPDDNNNIIRMGKTRYISPEPDSKINRLNQDSGIFSPMEIYNGPKPKGYENYDAVIMPKLYPINYEDIENDFKLDYRHTKYFFKIMYIAKKLFSKQWILSWGKRFIEIDYLRLDNIMSDKNGNVLFNDIDSIIVITKEKAQKNLEKLNLIEQDFIRLGNRWAESDYFTDIYDDGHLFPFFSFGGFY
tara:strand:- start:782 stop:1732 length:951 start_codon:yes stop_codon:yes gene_type:complete